MVTNDWRPRVLGLMETTRYRDGEGRTRKVTRRRIVQVATSHGFDLSEFTIGEILRGDMDLTTEALLGICLALGQKPGDLGMERTARVEPGWLLAEHLLSGDRAGGELVGAAFG